MQKTTKPKAPKGRHSLAQGNALGKSTKKISSLSAHSGGEGRGEVGVSNPTPLRDCSKIVVPVLPFMRLVAELNRHAMAVAELIKNEPTQARYYTGRATAFESAAENLARTINDALNSPLSNS
jgi:hypothetical protein